MGSCLGACCLTVPKYNMALYGGLEQRALCQKSTIHIKVTEHKSNRKRQNVDYSKFDAKADEPSPPHKCCKPSLLRKPSKTILAAHKKHKMMSPLSAGKMPITTKEKSVHVPGTEAKASTSTSTAAKAEPPLIGTLTVNASQEKNQDSHCCASVSGQ